MNMPRVTWNPRWTQYGEAVHNLGQSLHPEENGVQKDERDDEVLETF